MRDIAYLGPPVLRAISHWPSSGNWRAFRRNNSGAALLEFALLTPVLILIITGIIQFGSLFFLENNMANVARDTARRLAVGELTTQTEAETFVQDTLVNWGATFTVNVTEPDASSNDYVVQISVPMADASIVDPFGLMSSGTLSAQSTMRQES